MFHLSKALTRDDDLTFLKVKTGGGEVPKLRLLPGSLGVVDCIQQDFFHIKKVDFSGSIRMLWRCEQNCLVDLRDYSSLC